MALLQLTPTPTLGWCSTRRYKRVYILTVICVETAQDHKIHKVLLKVKHTEGGSKQGVLVVLWSIINAYQSHHTAGTSTTELISETVEDYNHGGLQMVWGSGLPLAGGLEQNICLLESSSASTQTKPRLDFLNSGLRTNKALAKAGQERSPPAHPTP
eukprot:scaffold97455_cov78-Attheya_sp.AAC.1